MNDMSTNNRHYDDRYYDNRDYDYRDYDYRDYDNRDYDYRRRSYDRRGGKINRRSYRNYREDDFYEELEMCIEDMREQYRKLEDVAEMIDNVQEKNTVMRVAQKEKENYNVLKQMVEKHI